jgi:hypothetical protein
VTKRFDGEWLLAVDENGKITVPIFEGDRPRATHYRVDRNSYNRAQGSIVLVPMRLVEEPTEPVEEAEVRNERSPFRPAEEIKELNPLEVRATREFECPHCGAEPGEFCVTSGGGIELRRYWQAERCCHVKRLKLVPRARIEDNDD